MAARDLRGLADAMQRQIGSGVAAVVSVVDGKAAVVVSVSDDLKGSVDAVELVRAGVAELGGKRPPRLRPRRRPRRHPRRRRARGDPARAGEPAGGGGMTISQG